MPKIIENLRNDILDESMEIIDAEGIEGMSIRRISSKLGIAPSTIYNYYRGKEQIIGALTKRRWDEALMKIDKACCEESSATKKLSMIVDELRTSVKPLLMFHISSAYAIKADSDHNNNHQRIIFGQLQIRVKKILEGEDSNYENMEFASSVITKLLVTCMHDDQLKFEELTEIIKKL